MLEWMGLIILSSILVFLDFTREALHDSELKIIPVHLFCAFEQKKLVF